MHPVDEITRDCFGAIFQVRRMDPATLPDPQLLHRRLCAFIDGMIAKARELGLSQEDVSDVAYAVVALADEVALALPGAVREFWMYNLLQLRYFNENVAGENFFRRVEVLRGDPRRSEVLKVYYLCLVLGFQGRYRVRGGEQELASLTETLKDDLARRRVITDEALSPEGGRPASAGGRARRALPIVWLSAAAIATALIINVALHVSLASGVGEVVSRIGTLTARATRK
jgi:type VI secretion system protein ImpK